MNRQAARDASLPEPEAALASIHAAQVRSILKITRLSLERLMNLDVAFLQRPLERVICNQ